MTSDKKQLRRELRGQRAALDPLHRAAASAAITGHVLGLPEYRAARTVGAYWPLAGEVDSTDLCARVLADGKGLFLPRVESDSEVSLRRVWQLDALMPGRFNILEPAESAAVAQPREVDLFLVPGLAFDALGGRLGYGRGYFDRLLHAARLGATFVGLCFEAVRVDEVPMEAHDVRMHLVITEGGVLEAP